MSDFVRFIIRNQAQTLLYWNERADIEDIKQVFADKVDEFEQELIDATPICKGIMRERWTVMKGGSDLVFTIQNSQPYSVYVAREGSSRYAVSLERGTDSTGHLYQYPNYGDLILEDVAEMKKYFYADLKEAIKNDL